MITQSNTGALILHFTHHNQSIIELKFERLGLLQSESLIDEYVQALSKMPRGKKAKVLINFEGTPYDPRMILFFKAQLGLLKKRVEKSAVIGVSSLIAIAIQGCIQTAAMTGNEIGPKRAVIFDNREAALDWLAASRA